MTTEATELTAQQIWDEEVGKREGATATAAAQANTPIEPNPDPERNDEKDDNANDSATNTGTVDAKQTGNEPQSNVQEPPKPDPLELVLEKLEKLESRQRNVEGHIGGLKTSQQALHAAMEQARKAPTAGGDAPTKGQVAAAAADPEQWTSLKKDFPEWAEATEALLGARLSALQTPSGGIDPAEMDKLVNERVAQATDSLREQLIDSHLEGIIEGWSDEVKTDRFKNWLTAQDAKIQALANSPHVKDAARMLRLYDASLKADPTKEIVEDRKQKLAQAAALPKGRQQAPTKTLEQMTPEEVWDYEAKKREKERAQRGY